MQVRRGFAIAGAFAVLTSALPAAGALGASGPAEPAVAPAVATAVACGSSWATIPSPNGNGASSELRAVAGTSASDIWAVGDTGTRPLIDHWNGTKWKVSAIPNAGTVLNSVVALSPANAWAAGYTNNPSGPVLATGSGLIEHWDGHAWKTVALPSPLGGLNSATAFDGIAALSAKDIWVVGQTGSAPYEPVALHYDGVRWKIVAVDTSTIGGSGRFTAITQVTANDAWAVGDIFFGDTLRLIEHWNGHAWTRVDAAQPTTDGSVLGVRAASSTDVYAVGVSITEFLPTMEDQRYNGHAWGAVAASAPPAVSTLNAVVVQSTTSIWAAGWFSNSSSTDAALVVHSTGAGFSRVAAPTAGIANGLALIGGKQLWLVGSSVAGTPPNEVNRTFVARRCV